MRRTIFLTFSLKNLDLKRAERPKKFLWHFTTEMFFESLTRKYEKLTNEIKKRNIFLRYNMMKARMLKLPFTDDRKLKFSLSNVCGHGAFILLAFSYLETEFLTLRVYAASGIFLSILFQ